MCHADVSICRWLSIEKWKCKVQTRSFSVIGPTTWNGLPVDLRHLPNGACSQLHHILKTVLFRLAWIGSASAWVGILKGRYINLMD